MKPSSGTGEINRGLRVNNKVSTITPFSAMITIFGMLVAIVTITGFATSENLSWTTVWAYLFSGRVVHGVFNTVLLTIIAMAIGTVAGFALAAMSMARNAILRLLAWLYIWIFRGTPLLVQLIFWFNLGLIFPNIWIGIPGTVIGIGGPTNQIMTGFVAALLGLGLNEVAIMSEVVRGGINAVPRGQSEAAHALGLTRSQSMLKVILPQTIRLIIPPFGNNVIYMLKNTSLVSVIAGSDLMTSVQQIYSQNFKVAELLIVASIWYLALTSVATIALAEYEAILSNRGWTIGETNRGPLTNLIRRFTNLPQHRPLRTNVDVTLGKP